MCPSAHPIKMQGMKMPKGTAVPDVKDKKINQIIVKIKAFGKRIDLWSDMKLLMVLA